MLSRAPALLLQDVIKSRIQGDRWGAEARYKGPRSARSTLKAYNIHAFSRGWKEGMHALHLQNRCIFSRFEKQNKKKFFSKKGLFALWIFTSRNSSPDCLALLKFNSTLYINLSLLGK